MAIGQLSSVVLVVSSQIYTVKAYISGLFDVSSLMFNVGNLQLLMNLGAIVPYCNFIFFLNITTVIDNLIIEKDYLLSDWKSTAKSVYYLHSRSINDRRYSLKLPLKFRYGTFQSGMLDVTFLPRNAL